MIDSDALDLILAGGRVIDVTGAPGVAANVGLSGDRITAFGDLSARPPALGQAARCAHGN